MHKLIDLPYAPDALEPVISAQTLAFHHGKHLQTYVDNLNKLIAGTPFKDMPLKEIVLKSEGAIFNNAGQILNHNLYFTQFCPAERHARLDRASDSVVMPGPTGHLKNQIEKQWGSLEAFQAEFVAKGVSLFGSGWVWLSADPEGNLVITQEPGANNPITKGLRPLLTFDVWEHAYYLDYQNRRAAQLQDLWGIVDWGVIGER